VSQNGTVIVLSTGVVIEAAQEAKLRFPAPPPELLPSIRAMVFRARLNTILRGQDHFEGDVIHRAGHPT